MNPTLYKATSEGNVDVLRQHNDQIALQVTPNRNTALHVAAQFGHSLTKDVPIVSNSTEICTNELVQENKVHDKE